MSTRVSLILVSFLVASCAAGPRSATLTAPEAAKPSPESPSEPYATIGDTLLISDPSNAEVLTLCKRIDLDGTILLPELGTVAVAGYTSDEIGQKLAQLWAPAYGKLELEVRLEQTKPEPSVESFVPPTLRARLAGLVELFRSWLREWILYPPILIAGNEPSPGLWVAKGQRPRVP